MQGRLKPRSTSSVPTRAGGRAPLQDFEVFAREFVYGAEVSDWLDEFIADNAPPLEPRDVVVLAGQCVALAQFHARVDRARTTAEEFIELERILHQLGMRVVAQSLVPRGSWSPRAAANAARWCSRERGTWFADALGPALHAPEPSPRQRRIVELWSGLFDELMRPNFASIASTVERTVEANSGESTPRRRDRRRREPTLERELSAGWLELIGRASAFSGLYEFDTDGTLRLRRDAATKALSAQIPPGRRRKRQTAEQQFAEMEYQAMSDARRAHAVPDDAIVALEQVRELRELRDEFDAAGHAHMARLARALSDRGATLLNRADQLRAVLRTLQSHSNRALQAAVVWELGQRFGDRRRADWSRDEIAGAYGVTARQVEHQRDRARKLLA